MSESSSLTLDLNAASAGCDSGGAASMGSTSPEVPLPDADSISTQIAQVSEERAVRRMVPLLSWDIYALTGYFLALPMLFLGSTAFCATLVAASLVGWASMWKRPGWSGHCPSCGGLNEVVDGKVASFRCSHRSCRATLSLQDGRFEAR